MTTGPEPVPVYIDKYLHTNPEPVELGPQHGNKTRITWINQAGFDVTVTIEGDGDPADPKSPFPSDTYSVPDAQLVTTDKIKDSSKKHQDYTYMVQAANATNDPHIIIDR